MVVTSTSPGRSAGRPLADASRVPKSSIFDGQKRIFRFFAKYWREKIPIQPNGLNRCTLRRRLEHFARGSDGIK